MLKNKYNGTGIDINKKEINSTRKNAKGANFIVASMLDFRLDEKFDIIICFDSIDHGDDLRAGILKTLGNMYLHLNNGGILIFSMSMAKDCWINGALNTTTFSFKGQKWVYTTHRYMRNNKLIFSKTILLLKNNKTYKESKTSILNYKYDLLEVAKIKDITDNMGFRTFVYRNWSLKGWNKNSKEQPIFVCIKG